MIDWLIPPRVSLDKSPHIWLVWTLPLNKKYLKKMLGQFATASRLTPIHQGSLAVLSRPACASMSVDIDNDNAWQRGPLWPHGMGPTTWRATFSATCGAISRATCVLVWKHYKVPMCPAATVDKLFSLGTTRYALSLSMLSRFAGRRNAKRHPIVGLYRRKLTAWKTKSEAWLSTI